jgi:hypothetical protein
MWQELLSALALVLVIEGILPFLNPRGFKRMMALYQQMEERTLRWNGLAIMLVGVAMLYLVR